MTALGTTCFPTRAGPFYRLLRGGRLVDGRDRVRWILLVAIAWLPLLAASLIRVLAGGRVDTIMRDPSVHVRLLISLPLLVLAEYLLEVRCRGAVVLLRAGHVEQRTQIDSILGRAEHLETSRLAEGAIAIVVLLAGQAALWGLAPPSGIQSGIDLEASVSVSRLWYATIALPLVQFMVLRWLWRWLVWVYVLARLSRLPLATNALHPDAAAGLKFLSTPIDAFAVFVTSNLAVASAAWTAQIHQHHYPIETYVPRFLAFLLLAIVAACGPLLLFAGQLYRARYRDVESYHALAHQYVHAFRRKWLAEPSCEPVAETSNVLGTADIQSLNDLCGSFEKAADTRVVPFGKRPIIGLAIGALVPMVPLVLATVPLDQIARQLAKMLQLPTF